MRYIIFTRVSTELQTVENQLQECLEYIRPKMKPEDELITFEEPATSSRIPMKDRKKLQEMLDCLRTNDTLVIYKLDRLARKGHELSALYHVLSEKKVNLVSIHEPNINTILIHVYAIVGESERENVRLRTISGLNRKRQNGEKVGAAYYGYKTDPTKLQMHQPNTHSYGKPYILIPDESESKQVEIMLQLRKEGYSCDKIAKKLSELGYRNRKGNDVEASTVFRVLKRIHAETPSLLKQA